MEGVAMGIIKLGRRRRTSKRSRRRMHHIHTIPNGSLLSYAHPSYGHSVCLGYRMYLR